MLDHATINRQRKAVAMARVIDANARRQGVEPDDQAMRILLASQGWSDAVWHQIAKDAQYTSKKPPGDGAGRAAEGELMQLHNRASLASLIVGLGMQDEFLGRRRGAVNHASERARPLAEKKQRRAKRKQRRNR